MNYSYLKDYSIQMEDRRVSVGLGSSSTSIPVNSLSIDNIDQKYAGVTNAYKLHENTNDCNPLGSSNYFGNYFKSCQRPSVMWGSERPLPEVCPTDYKDHSGQPCHSIWNNLTRRKSIVMR